MKLGHMYPALRMENLRLNKFKASLYYVERLCLKRKHSADHSVIVALVSTVSIIMYAVLIFKEVFVNIIIHLW